MRTEFDVLDDYAVPEEDPRKTGLKNGLRQLSIHQLRRVLDYPDEMVLNTFNYQDGKFCPLAVALGMDNMPHPSQDKVFEELIARGWGLLKENLRKSEDN